MAIRKRGTRWTVKVYDKTTGGQRWIGTYPTRREAVDAEHQALASLIPASRARTVEEWSVVWLRDYARPAHSTRNTYRYATERIVKDIGDQRMDRLDRPSARRIAQAWPKAVARVARTMFADAMRDGVIHTNPFSGLRLETPKGRRDLTALTEPEIRSLADAALTLGEYGPEFRAVILFLAYVGVRPGELACIRRDDLNQQAGEVLVRYALDGEGGEKAPKNGQPRTVTVPPPALHALTDIPPRLDSPYLFHTPTGKRLSRGTIHYWFRAVRIAWGKRAKLEPYELRHAAATLLMERGLPPHVVAHQLGHVDGGRLVQVLYGHPQERGMRDQVKLAFAGWTEESAPATSREREVS